VICGSSQAGKVFPLICTPGIPTLSSIPALSSWCGGRRWWRWGCL